MAQAARSVLSSSIVRPSSAVLLSSTTASTCFACHFSTTPSPLYPRDNNPNRGVSALRRTGLRFRLSVHRYPLPKPVLDPALRPKTETDKDHGLWGFFNQKRDRIPSPTDESAYGRPWTVGELRTKSWEDLHSLWWVCMKDMNRLSTAIHELKRTGVGFGEQDFEKRIEAAKRTQKYIKWALTERWYAWEDARRLAAGDASVDLTAEAGGAYNPRLDKSRPLTENDKHDKSEVRV